MDLKLKNGAALCRPPLTAGRPRLGSSFPPFWRNFPALWRWRPSVFQLGRAGFSRSWNLEFDDFPAKLDFSRSLTSILLNSSSLSSIIGWRANRNRRIPADFSWISRSSTSILLNSSSLSSKIGFLGSRTQQIPVL